MIEQLEARLQFANLSGQVFHDTDSSETLDASEKVYRGWQVYIDSNANGQYDAGEPTTTTNSKGQYSFNEVPKGTYLIGVVAPSTDYLQTTPGPDGSSRSGVHINVTFSGAVTSYVHKAFIDAAEKWESILTGVKLNGVKINDTINITASEPSIDGVDGILGQSAPTDINKTTELPDAGFIELDSSDLKEANGDGQLLDIVTHEMAHVLGFGTVWNLHNVTAADNSKNPRFVGTNAVAAFDKLFDTSSLSIPLENGGFEGTRDSHWEEDVLTQELMTGYVSAPGTANPLSIVTVGQFQDLGYTVNYKAADVWKPLKEPEVVVKTTPLDFGGVADERSVTVGVHDKDNDLNFGYRVNNPPVINSFTISPANGNRVTLTAAKVIDYDGDGVQGVSFWRESNGIEGLQKGVGGDTFIAAKTAQSGKGAYTAQSSLDGLASGDQIYYAVASDTLGDASRRQGTYTITSQTIPTRPTDVTFTQATDTTETFSFDDTDTGLTGFHVQVATSPTFDTPSLVKVFNLSPDTMTALITGLSPGTHYYVEVRGYNTAGSGQYASSAAFETSRGTN